MPLPSHLKALLGHSIAFHASLAELTGSLAAGLLLSQAVYWATRTKDPDGWFYKTQADWCAETGLTRAEQKKARAQLRGFAFWREQRRGVPATLHYRVDFSLLALALERRDADLTLEQVLLVCATFLKQLSKVGYMRACKVPGDHEFVDYAEVLRAGGMTCGVCSQPILRSLGPHPDALTFAYRLPLPQGGSHTRQNLHPVHRACAAPKNAREHPAQWSSAKPTEWSYRKRTELSYDKRTDGLTVSQLDFLPKADQMAYTKPSLPYRAKITSEITTEITSSSAQVARTSAPATAKPLQALYCGLTGNPWRPSDEEVAARFQEVDPRKIELALLETLIETTQQQIHSFKYFVPRLQLWLAAELSDMGLDTVLAMRRQRWQQEQGAGARCPVTEKPDRT